MLCCLWGRSKDSNQFSASTMQTKIIKLGLVRLGEAKKTLSGVGGAHETHSYCGAGSLLINCQAHCFVKVFSQSEILRLLAEIFTVRPAILSSNWKVMILHPHLSPTPPCFACLCASLCTASCSTYGGQKKASYPLELKGVVSHRVGAGHPLDPQPMFINESSHYVPSFLPIPPPVSTPLFRSKSYEYML